MAFVPSIHNFPSSKMVTLGIAMISMMAASLGTQGIPVSTVQGPFTDHFQNWLQQNNYGTYEFASAHLGSQASFGGKEHDGHKIKMRPVIFIHGNSDGALADGMDEWAQGWSASIEHFLANGYTSAELYALTYGDRDLSSSLQRSVDCPTLTRIRRFVEAVMEYTGADQLDIIAHSMGVTLARHVIQGRSASRMRRNGKDSCHLGPSMRHRVRSLVGIAGANYGLCICADEKLAETVPACSKHSGFWASSGCSDAPMHECSLERPSAPERAHCHGNGRYAEMLHTLNRPEKPKDAHFVVSIWSDADAILGATNFAWGRLTSMIPNSDHSVIYKNHTHYSLKWMTVEDQFGFVVEHANFNTIHNSMNNTLIN